MRKRLSGHSLLASVLVSGILVLGTVGCGSDSTQNTGLSGPPAQGSTLPQTQYLLGRVLLDGPKADVRVQIVDLGGQVLHEFTTDRRGWFQRAGTVPRDFSVLAYVGQDVYRREVRGGWPRGTLYVSTGTTLLSAVAKAHPEFTLDQAESGLRAALNLPSRYRMSWVGQVHLHNFSEKDFLAGVQQAGSLQTYLDRRVAGLQIRPLEISSDIEKLTKTFVEDTIASIWGNSVNVAIGDALSNMGFSFTTPAAINRVDDDVTAVLKEIDDLVKGLSEVYNQKELSDALAPLKQAADSLNAQLTVFQSTVKAYGASHNDSNSNVPQPAPSPDSDYSKNRATVLAYDVAATALPIEALQDGTIQALFFANRSTSGWQYLPDKNLWQSYPWRRNSVTREAQTLLAQNWGSLQQAMYLQSEISNASSPSSQATQLTLLNQSIQRWTTIIQEANFYVPDQVVSDDLLYDVNTGVCWFNEFLPATDSGTAPYVLSQLTTGPAGETVPFSLPVRNEVHDLTRNRIALQIDSIRSAAQQPSGRWGDASTQEWKTAFGIFGFDTSYYANVDNAGFGGSDDNEGTWIQWYNSDGNSYDFVSWNNDGSNPDDDRLDGHDPKVTCSYLGRINIHDVPDRADQAEGGDDPAQMPLGVAHPSPWSFGISQQPMEVLLAGYGTNNNMSYQALARLVFEEIRYPGGPVNLYNKGTKYDVTNRAVWSSSDPRILTISNLYSSVVPAPRPDVLVGSDGSNGTVNNLDKVTPLYAGQYVWHPPIFPSDPPLTPVTLTAKVRVTTPFGYPNTITQSYTVNPVSNMKNEIVSCHFTPRNQQIIVSSRDAAPVIPFYVTGYFKDARAVDLSLEDSTTWELLDSQGNVISNSTEGGFGLLSFKNQLVLYPGLSDRNLTVRVTYDHPTLGRATDVAQFIVDVTN